MSSATPAPPQCPCPATGRGGESHDQWIHATATRSTRAARPDAGTGDDLLDLIKTYGERMRRIGYAEARGDGDTAFACHNAAMAALGQVIAARRAEHA